MYKLLLILGLLGLMDQLFAQSPHGKEFKMNCAACHSSDNWEISENSWDFKHPDEVRVSRITGWKIAADTFRFNHYNTSFPLEGGHAGVDCRLCHTTLVFTETNTDCISCHTDVHQQTLGSDCARCHTEESWLINDINPLHDINGFPLVGIHSGLDCRDCHTSESELVFNRIGNDCVNCHLDDFTATINPDHVEAGFSHDCIDCHDPGGMDWSTDEINHDFFPLTEGHDIQDCAACHIGGDFSNTPNTCVGCHTEDHTQSINPNHLALNLSTDCATCHSTVPDWMPARFDIHDDFYPLNGAHATIANDCAICHNGDYNNTPNTCIGCHEQDFSQTTNPDHAALNFSTDCASCHNENEWIPATFDHDGTYFPIYSGTHNGVWADCLDCHTNPSNYAEFTCVTCHVNPETDDQHVGVGGYVYESTACLACHPTGEGDGGFDHNLTNFPLTGAHITVECLDCHTNGYEGTPTDCAACHSLDFNQSTNPNHNALGLSTDCINCHTTEPGWMPASFPVHDDYYALDGAHAMIANDCVVCHNGDYNNTPNTCVGCHQSDFNATTSPDHEAAQFPVDCESCHNETAWIPSSFNHDIYYPLTGAHFDIAEDCAACHINGNYENTPNTCVGCHAQDHTESVNPSHVALNLSMDCISCHTIEPDWMPATFDIHDDFYPLNGAHATIANDCAACHNGDYNNTPNTCFGCHAQDYNQTTDPNHAAVQFSTDCIDCHTESEWVPATFDHDGEYFPIYSGTHQGEWDNCTDCHTNPSNFAEFTCVTCHINPETDNEHNGVGGYVYESNACLACHPTGDAEDGFDHNQTNFPLTGAHTTIECLDCHANGFQGTPTDCAACHTVDFNGTTNPNHGALDLSTDCVSCHTTEVGWSPASFDVHNDFHPLNGAHASIANDCATCHNGDFSNTPNTCVGCHQSDFNATTSPDHEAAQFPVDCETCHSETTWIPSTFDHSIYYPFTGAHLSIADDCTACHINGEYDNTPNTCVGCHAQDHAQSTNPNHSALGLSTDCVSCHSTEPDWMPASFDIHDNFYPLNGAHAGIANDCVACHNGNYNNTPNTCFGCHAQDYNQANNPNHLSAQFPTDCTECHNETAWSPSNFDHDGQYFPIYSGNHQNGWDQCTECHTSPGDFSVFSCIDCHEHNDLNQLANDHQDVNNYQFNSNACFECHPNGD